ncbi:gliding motility-associated C-terminal domain-containing protein [Draconibacterium sediminis]|uniref:T9SS type B sorting domain-containing protein n=1 Tax=Draconibacterium sediminis TaxID=1544798 RepID=UPI0026F2C581|nr:gliding motility-associated C-terminal domain-containing protein [Draconibacterium sediminis]
MTPFFAYLIKSSVSLALLYCLFRLTVRNDNNHRLTRFLLLSIMVLSASIPFLTVQLFYKEIEMASAGIAREIVSAPLVTQSMDSSVRIQTPVLENIPPINYWAIFYTAIISLLLFRLLFGIYRVSSIIKNAEKHRFREIILAVVKDFVQPFTFLNKVVLSEKDFHENKAIVVAHEYAHIRHKHAVDLLFCELFTVLHFFNPFMWLLCRDLKLVHEYQADEAVLNTGIDAQKYQLLVLEKAVGERRFAMANHFTQKPIVKRLKMMTKTKRQKWGMVKVILFVPLIIVLLQAFARPDLITKSADFIPVRYTENKAEQWLAKWNIDKIGDGIYQPDFKDKNAPRQANNVLVILMNAKDEYLIENQYPGDKNIKQIVEDYLRGKNPDGNKGPDFIESEIPGIGTVKVSEGWISYRNDIESSGEAINFTLRQIGEAYLEVREAKAFILFGKKYLDLDEEKQKTVNEIIPIRFSYETPKNPRSSTWLPFDGKPSPEPKPMELLVRYDGTIVFGSKTYENLEEFEHDLKVWKQELEAISKEEKTNHYYRVNATFEHGSETQQICSKEISKINYMLWKQSMHVEQIHHVFPEELNKPGLEMDKLKARVDQNSELFIPEGFSPDGDGIHDFFEIKGIYPQYQDAKLVIFNNEGQKVSEKKNYGNTDIWGKGKEWWDGTSENTELSAGKYNYKLELGNGEVKNGTLLLAKMPPPHVLGIVPDNPQYPIPSIRFHEKWLSVNRESYELTDLKNVLENLLPNDGTQRKVELVVFSTVSNERTEQIYAELQNVDDLEIIRKDVTPPPPPPLKPITLKKDGTINLGGKEYSFEEFEQRIIAMEVQHRRISNKNDVEGYKMRAKVNIEEGTDDSHIIRLKEIMKKGRFDDIAYSILPSPPK